VLDDAAALEDAEEAAKPAADPRTVFMSAPSDDSYLYMLRRSPRSANVKLHSEQSRLSLSLLVVMHPSPNRFQWLLSLASGGLSSGASSGR
jgi:hypothetical protein